jgi:nucleoside-diphosphate-sugar epimerase
MMRALITGHEGFVGRHLVPKLEGAGYKVQGTEDVLGFLASPLAETSWDVVVHLAANIINVHDRGRMGMRGFDDLDLDRRMCAWVEQNPPRKAMVVMSSCALDFPDDPYCIVKRTLEAFAQTLHRRRVPVVVLRPYSGYGPDQSLEYPFRAILGRALRHEDPLTVWGGSQVRDWVHIDDLTDAIVYGIDHFPHGEPVAIGTGVGTDFFTLAEKMAAAVGYAPQVVGDASKQSSSPRRVADTCIAAQHGWQATITLEEGIARAVSIHREMAAACEQPAAPAFSAPGAVAR